MAASIIAVAGAIYHVSQKLRKFAKTLAHAAREVKYIAREMDIFSSLLRAARNIFQSIKPEVVKALKLSKMCRNLVKQANENVQEFDKFLSDLEPLRHSIDANLIAKTVARLRWNARKNDMVLLKSKLEASKSTLILCMNIINTRDTVEDLGEAKRRIEKDRAEIEDLHEQM